LTYTIVGCRTTEYIEIPVQYEQEDFNSVPEKIEQEKPESVKDLGDMIIYYEDLLQEWESWGISIYETLEIKLPDSLQSIKTYLERQNESKTTD
jgi:hypothetical protein